MIWRRRRCSSYARPLGFLCFVFCVWERGEGEICTGTEREREGGKERERREFRGMMDGGKYERERKVMEGFDSFGILLLLPSVLLGITN